MYKNYVFDLYGTLVDINTNEWKRSLWEKMRLFYGYYGAHYKVAELQKAYGEIVGSKEAELRANGKGGDGPHYSHESYPEIEIEYVFRELYRRKGVDASLELSCHTGQFFRVVSTKYIKLYDGAIEFLDSLKAKGKNVYLLSNAQRIFTEYEMVLLGIHDKFDDIFISSTEGVRKPDAEFFNRLIDKHKLDVKESIMIGNDQNSDIGGARKVGMDTFYIHSNISPELKGEVNATYSLPAMDLRKVMEMIG